MKTHFLGQLGDLQRGVPHWVLYDVASSAYLMLIPGLGFSVYFRSHVVTDPARADALWGIAVALPLAAAGLLAPLLGALFDRIPDRRLPLAGLTVVCCAATASLWGVERGEVTQALVLFGIAQLAYILAFSLYESWLPRLSSPDTVGRVSGLAWGLGFAGSIACLALCLPLMSGGLGIDNLADYRLAFPLTALFFLLLALPAVPGLRLQGRLLRTAGAGAAFRDVLATLTGWRRRPVVARYLIGYYLVNDAIVTFVFFNAIFLKVQFGLSMEELLWMAVLFHVVAIPATPLFGWLGDRVGLLLALNLTFAIWLALILTMAFASHPQTPVLLVGLLGCAIGSSQALLRAIYSRVIPVEHSAQYFGFQTLAGRLSAILGPLLFGAVSALTGDQRIAVLSLLLFLMPGAWLINGLRKEIALLCDAPDATG